MALDAKGSSGGLEIVWDPNLLHMEGFFSSIHTLLGWFRILGTNQAGVITNVYGPQQTEQKISFLNHLRWLHDPIPSPNWIIGGDFNIISSLEEKKEEFESWTEIVSFFNC